MTGVRPTVLFVEDDETNRIADLAESDRDLDHLPFGDGQVADLL